MAIYVHYIQIRARRFTNYLIIWLKTQAFKQNKTQGLYLTEILELARKLKDA
jgi:hypothetical protein